MPTPSLPLLHQPAAPRAAGDGDQAARRAALKEASVAFEATFLAEMLRHGGAGSAPRAFGGGAGEAAFSGELVAAQARSIAQSGGLGVAEALFSELLKKEGLE